MISPSDIFKTRQVGRQVRLLLAEKKSLTRKRIYALLGCTERREKHAAANAIAELRNKNQIVETNGIITYTAGPIRKPKVEALWDALRDNPGLTVSELILLTGASRSHVRSTLYRYVKAGLVRKVGTVKEPAIRNRQSQYALVDRDMRMPS